MLTTRPTGTNDFLPGESEKWQYIEQLCRQVCAEYGYQEIRLIVKLLQYKIIQILPTAYLIYQARISQYSPSQHIFAGTPVNISVKTRIGVDRVEEFGEILDVFNQFPTQFTHFIKNWLIPRKSLPVPL